MKKMFGVLTLLLAASLGVAHADSRDRNRHDTGSEVGRRATQQYYDQRYNHDHYYPSRGVIVRSAPAGRYTVYRGRDPYYYSGGVWYRPRGPRFVVVGPPLGVFVPVLPRFYATLWFCGIPYYYANETYYMYRGRERGYETVDAPPGAPTRTENTEDSGEASSADDLFVYPKNGQGDEQTSRDRFECHQWAVKQTRFDPTETGGGVNDGERDSARAGYFRAMTACLEGRGYSVK